MATLQNIGILKYRGKDGNWHPLPVVLQSSGGGSGGISTISGKGQPGTSTVGRLNQLYRDESTDKLYICTSDTGGSYTWAAVVSDTENAVTYTAQTLTNAQKQQARANIGAGTSNFSGSYNDLTNKPNIPAASVIDTTLTQSGQAADAKAVGDALANKADTAAVNSALANKANTTDVNSALANKADTSAIPNVPAWALAASKPTYTAAEVGALPNTTVIPDVSGKLDKAQGAANAGKFMGVGNDGNITPVDKPTYTLPVATASVLGGVKPIAKTSAMTQDVGVDSVGKLYTAPSSDGSGGTDKSLGITSATVGQIAKITAVDASGKPTGWEPVDMPSGGTYTLPIASPTVLGGVKPIAKTDAMTQGVGVDEAGALWIAALGGNEIWGEVYSVTFEEETTTFDADLGANYKKIIIAINAAGTVAISANRTIRFVFNQYDKNVFGNNLMSSQYSQLAYCIEVYDAFILSRRMHSYLATTLNAQPFSGGAGITGIGNRAAIIRDDEMGINHINMSTLSSFAFQSGEVIKVYGVLA